METEGPGAVGRVDVIRALSRIAPLGPEDEAALSLPERLYGLGGESFSSDPKTAASSLEGFFYLGLPLPPKIPEYAISLSMKGGELRCTFIDRKRKVLANVPVRSAGLDGDWGALTLAIRSAERKLRKETGSGRKPRFIMAGEDRSEPVY